MIEFNLNSPSHISALFFGGALKEEMRIECGVFKSGKNPGAIKYKSVIQLVDIKGFGLSPYSGTNGKGVYSVDEEVLKKIVKEKNIQASKAAELLLQIRGIQKMISTYYEGIEKVLYGEDDCVHTTYTHVLIPTSRLSCSNPNMQNQPKPPEKITEHFISRFIKGQIIIADYKSLEPRVEAQLCGDKNLRRDVEQGIDVHTKNLALAEKMAYKEVARLIKEVTEWSQKRSKIKGFTFSQQYLASIRTTARNSGLTEKEVENILEARKKEYPDLYKWHEKHQKEVEAKSYYKNFAGMMFKFNKYESKNSNYPEPYYSKNEISNYETQGTAWLIAGTMIGRFWREKAIWNRNIKCSNKMCEDGIIYGGPSESKCLDCNGTGTTTKYLMVNTIHDNLILDCKEEFVETAKNDLKLLTDWKNTCIIFKYDWEVEIEIDVKQGSSWYECF